MKLKLKESKRLLGLMQSEDDPWLYSKRKWGCSLEVKRIWCRPSAMYYIYQQMYTPVRIIIHI